MYQMEPVGVVIPRDADDVQAALELARKHGVAFLSRGGGTSLTGQTVNHALVLDFSRYMNNVLEVNARGEVGARAARRRAGRAEPPRAAAWACSSGPTPRPRTAPPSAACSATTPAARTRSPTGLTVDHVHRDHRAAVRRHAGPCSARSRRRRSRRSAGCRALEGDDLPRGRARSATTYARRDPRALSRRSGGAWPATTSTSCSACRCGRTRWPAAATARRGRSAWRGSSRAPRARSSRSSRPRCGSWTGRSAPRST